MEVLKERQKEEKLIIESIKQNSEELLKTKLLELEKSIAIKHSEHELNLQSLESQQQAELKNLQQRFQNQKNKIAEDVKGRGLTPANSEKVSSVEFKWLELEFQQETNKLTATHEQQKHLLNEQMNEFDKSINPQKVELASEVKKQLEAAKQSEVDKTKAQFEYLIVLAKMFCRGFYYKGLEEKFLGLFKESLESLENAFNLAKSFLGPFDKFTEDMKTLFQSEQKSIARKKKMQKAHEIDWKGQDMARKRTSYLEVFKITSKSLEDYEKAIPNEYKTGPNNNIENLQKEKAETPMNEVASKSKNIPKKKEWRLVTLMAHFM